MAFKRTVTLRASFRFPAIRFDASTLLSFSGFTHAHAKCPSVVVGRLGRRRKKKARGARWEGEPLRRWQSYLHDSSKVSKSCKSYISTVLHEIFAGVNFCALAIFCVLRELIFAIRTDWFFFLGINFCDFQKVPSTQVCVRAIEIHIFKHYYGMRTLCKTSNSLYASLFLNELGGKL